MSDAKPQKATMINTGQQVDQATVVEEMPMQFQLYSDLASKGFGNENR